MVHSTSLRHRTRSIGTGGTRGQPELRPMPLFATGIGGRGANNDQVLARGAHVGDRICLFEPTRFGCETIAAGNEHLTLTSQPTWQPSIQVTPVTSVTLNVTVSGVPSGATGLRAVLYPLDDDPLPPAITLNSVGSGVYSDTFSLAYPLQGAYIHLPWHGAGAGSCFCPTSRAWATPVAHNVHPSARAGNSIPEQNRLPGRNNEAPRRRSASYEL